jgi:primosomal protein N' (replication factor Y)
LRTAEADGWLTLAWVLRPGGAKPRLRRFASLTDEGRAAAGAAGGDGARGTRLGPRQLAVLDALREADEPRPAAELAARHGGSAITSLARRGLVRLESEAVARRPLAERPARDVTARPSSAALSEEQVAAVAEVQAAVQSNRYEPFLLEGVAAAGKTAVYVELCRAALATGRGALVLVPEIALATPLLDRLRADLGIEPAVLHSGLSDGERADEWRRIRTGDAPLIVGTRLAVLAPLPDVGLIVVDEEHDPGYKSDRTPRYQARDLALELGRLAAAPVVLGSATPDVASVGRAQAGELRHLRLADRQAGEAARVELVDLRAELAAGNRGLLSMALESAIDGLDREQGDRCILVLNRRGSASVVLCRDCGYVQVCPECQRPLVYHAAAVSLRCHHCGASAPIARRCPACASVRIKYLGGGTERLERQVAERFPRLRVGRLDRDVVERRGAAERVVDDFVDGRLDVLVGTSLVTKSFDIPEVTLVGIVSADVALNLPDERAAERTYQLLAQAVGRAGRGTRPGRAIVQTYQPEHPAIQALVTGDQAGFYASELETRRLFGSPPYGHLVKLTCSLEDRDKAEAEAKRFAAELRERTVAAGRRTTVLGPAPAYIARRAGKWRFTVVLRGADPLGILGGDPGVPWSVDVDPESLL